MDNPTEFSENDNLDLPKEEGLTLTNTTLSYIKETANWTQFLAVLGFIVVALMVISSLSSAFLFNEIPDEFDAFPVPMTIFPLLSLLFALLYFLPVFYLFKFGTNVKQALNANDSIALEDGFKNLKSHYKFLGILTICLIGLYILIILGLIIFSRMM